MPFKGIVNQLKLLSVAKGFKFLTFYDLKAWGNPTKIWQNSQKRNTNWNCWEKIYKITISACLLEEHQCFPFNYKKIPKYKYDLVSNNSFKTSQQKVIINLLTFLLTTKHRKFCKNIYLAIYFCMMCSSALKLHV